MIFILIPTGRSFINEDGYTMPRIVDKDAKKMEILHVAMQVFAQKGVVKTKMIDIATAAGIGKGTIYEYFSSKEDIFKSAFVFFFQSLDDTIQKAIGKTDNPMEQLTLVVEKSFVGILHSEAGFAEIMMDFWAEGVRNKDREVLDTIDLKGIYAGYRKVIKQILDNGIREGVFREVDTTAMASLLIGAMDGIMLQWILDHKAVNIRKGYQVLLESMIEGIKL